MPDTRSPRVISAVYTCMVVALLGGTPVHAQTPPTPPTPALSLSVNHSFAPTIYQGWPVVFELALTTPSVAQSNGNAVPITLNLPSGSWADGVQLAVTDASGNTQTWPATLVFHPTGADGAIVLNAGVEGRLAWAVAPSSTAAIAAGTYRASALLNVSTATAPGAFNGFSGSNSVTITLGAEPSPLPATAQVDKYTLFATYDVLQGNLAQATTDLNTLLTNQPGSIVALTSMGDLLNLQGQPAKALTYFDQAVAAFAAANPSAPEPLTGLADRQASTRAALLSQSGSIALPQVNLSLVNQGIQSPGIYFFDLVLQNTGAGIATLPQITQLSYLVTSGTGQPAYDTTLSPPFPAGADSLAPGASSTVRIYLDVPSSVSQFAISFAGNAQDLVGTLYNFSGSQSVTPGSIVSTGAPLTVTAANAAQQYGQPTPNLNTATYSGFVNGDTPASLRGTLKCTTPATPASPVGAYPITCSGLSSPNYVITYVPGTLTITPAPLTLASNNITQVYGAPTPPLTGITSSGFVNGDSLTSLSGTLNCTTTATQASPVGSYPITCAGLTSANYSITFAPGVLTIGPAPLTITANNATRAYGQPNPSLNNVAASGFVNGDTLASLLGTLTCSTSATPSSSAGTYPITCSGLMSPNYSITYVAGSLVVTNDALTITANSVSRQYGQPNPPLNNVSYVGFVNGDTPASLAGTLTCTTSAVPASSVGVYPINCSGLTSPNYIINFVSGTFTITPVPLVIAANNASRPYGANNPPLAGTLNGLQNADPITATFATAAVPMSPVGAYPITPTVLDPANRLGNYNVSLVNGTLSIVPEATTIAVAISPSSIPIGQPATVTVTLTAPDFVIAIDPSVLAPITLTSPIATDVLSNNGACTPVPAAAPGVASCSVTVIASEPNGRTLKAAFGGTADLAPSTGTGNLIVTAALQSQQACVRSDFRNVAVPGGSTIWFNSIFKVHGVAKQLFHVTFFQATAQFHYTDASGTVVTVNQPMPDAQIAIDPNATQASTTFDPVNNVWSTTIPFDLDDSAFLTGMPWPVPAAGLPADVEPVTVCGTFASDISNVDIGWRWAAAAYSTFGTDGTTLGVKPFSTDDDNAAANRDRAGTPENYKHFVIPGARGKGGKNYTGSYSGTATIE